MKMIIDFQSSKLRNGWINEIQGKRGVSFSSAVNKFIKAMSRRQSPQNYRIIDQTSTEPLPYLPALSNPKMLQSYTKSLLKSRQFLYIDVHEQAGYHLMKECDSSDEEDEVDKIGDRYSINLNNLNTENAKGVNYVLKDREESQKKEHALCLLREGLRRSTERIKNIHHPETYPIYHQSLGARQLTAIRSQLSNSQAHTLSLSRRTSLSRPHPAKPYATLPTRSPSPSPHPPSPSPRAPSPLMSQFRLKRMLPEIRRRRGLVRG